MKLIGKATRPSAQNPQGVGASEARADVTGDRRDGGGGGLKGSPRTLKERVDLLGLGNLKVVSVPKLALIPLDFLPLPPNPARRERGAGGAALSGGLLGGGRSRGVLPGAGARRFRAIRSMGAVTGDFGEACEGRNETWRVKLLSASCFAPFVCGKGAAEQQGLWLPHQGSGSKPAKPGASRGAEVFRSVVRLTPTAVLMQAVTGAVARGSPSQKAASACPELFLLKR